MWYNSFVGSKGAAPKKKGGGPLIDKTSGCGGVQLGKVNCVVWLISGAATLPPRPAGQPPA
jgi:hypothetical protein